MAVAVNDVLRVALTWLVNGADQVVNVHTFEVDDLGLAADDTEFMEDLAGVALPLLYDSVLDRIANNVVGYLLTGMNLTKEEVLPPVSQALNGTGSGADCLPLQVTALVYWSGDEPRRQARTYLPPFNEGENEDTGLWGSGTQAALATMAVVGLSPISGDEITVSKRIGTNPFAGFVVPTLGGYSTAARTQRRRTLGRGA